MRVIVIHHNDADGRASAAIVANWYRSRHDDTSLRYIECDYNDISDLELVDVGDAVYIVDFSLAPEIMEKIIKRASKVVWCDHHKTAEKYKYDVVGLRDFTEKGLAGCEVTWKYLHPDTPTPNWITMLGDYDAWRMEFKPECLQFYEGLRLSDQSPTGGIWDRLFNGSVSTSDVIQAGRIAMAYRDNYCAEIRKSYGYETTIMGHSAYAVNIYKFGSQGFGGLFKEYPVCIAYIHDGERFTVSLYSETVDVGKIAEALGGGGHKGAAGFVCDALPFSRL